MSWYLSAEDVLDVLAIVGLGALAVVMIEEATRPASTYRTLDVYDRRQGYPVTLSEDHQRRLEDGETVRFTRWHGYDLELSGEVVGGGE